jgi:hypothetical protein
MSNSGLGLLKLYLEEIKYICSGLLLYAGPFGKQETEHALKKKLIKNPIEILFSACAFIRYWAGLYPEETQKLIQEGVDLMMKTAIKLIGKKEETQGVPALQGGEHEATGHAEDEQKDKAARTEVLAVVTLLVGLDEV